MPSMPALHRFDSSVLAIPVPAGVPPHVALCGLSWRQSDPLFFERFGLSRLAQHLVDLVSMGHLA